MSGASASSGLRVAFSYCVQKLRIYDYHHYLCLLVELPPDMRRAAFALRAFNVETSRAIDIASDPKIELMRLLWWEEAINKRFANKITHPTAQALASVISEHKVSKSWLKLSVEAGINDAQRKVTAILQTVKELEKYAEDTVSTILYTTLQAGGITSTTADHAASHIGKASGVLLLLRSLPYHASCNHHFSYIPVEVAAKHGLLVKQGGQSGIRMDSREGLCDVVFEMASVANSHLQKARELAGTVPAEARPVLLACPGSFGFFETRAV